MLPFILQVRKSGLHFVGLSRKQATRYRDFFYGYYHYYHVYCHCSYDIIIIIIINIINIIIAMMIIVLIFTYKQPLNKLFKHAGCGLVSVAAGCTRTSNFDGGLLSEKLQAHCWER